MTNQDSLITTGVAGLDLVLGGGLSPASLALIIGAPGAGKTVLSSQMVFKAASNGARALILTSYSEGPVKYLEHLQSFAFFDATLVGGLITLLSMPKMVTHDGETATAALIRTIRETGARLVLIDGFQGLAPLLPDGRTLRLLLAALSTQLSYINATLLITFTGDARNPQLHPELTTADVVFGLTYTLDGVRHLRRLEVVKQRGRAQLPGQHSYTISPQGITVYPRLEVSVPAEERTARVDTRCAFGLPELDTLLGGGLTVGTATILAGAPGTGKTILALHWAVMDARPDAVTVFLTFGEYPAQLTQKAATFGIGLDAAVAAGAVQIRRLTAIEPDADVIGQQVREALSNLAVRRLVVDDSAVLLRVLKDRAQDYLAALRALLYAHGVTGLFSVEINPFEGLHLNLVNTPIGVLGENLVVVQQYEVHGALHRVLAVLRMRFSDYDRTLRELVLDAGGVRVLRPDETEAGVLETAAQASGGVAPGTSAHS